jgi:uncharacterized repeat protein (TIGR01451 family)
MLQKRLVIPLVLFLLTIYTTCNTALGANVITGLIGSSALQVNLTNQNPDPARPGEPVELTVSVQNIGSNNLKDIVVAIKPKARTSFYPFSQLTGESLTQSISYLNARQDNNDATVLKFKLMTDANVAEGVYYIDITTSAKKADSSSDLISTTNTFQIDVRGKEYAQIVTINQSSIDVGKEEPLEFIITNTGTSPLQNMVVSWKDPKGVILPVYSDNTKYIKHLDANQSVTVDYSIMADVNANPGLYTLDISLNFENYNSQPKSIQTTAGLFVGGPTDFDVSYSESSQGQISLAVANVGNNMADAVKVSIPDQASYNVSGSPSTIVGNLQKGDYTIASFNVTNTQTSTSTNPLIVQIEYTDPQGNRITVDKNVVVPATGIEFATTRARNSNSSNNNSNSIIVYGIIIVVVAGISFFFYRRQKQGGKKVELTAPVVSKEDTQPKQ